MLKAIRKPIVLLILLVQNIQIVKYAFYLFYYMRLEYWIFSEQFKYH